MKNERKAPKNIKERQKRSNKLNKTEKKNGMTYN